MIVLVMTVLMGLVMHRIFHKTHLLFNLLFNFFFSDYFNLSLSNKDITTILSNEYAGIKTPCKVKLYSIDITIKRQGELNGPAVLGLHPIIV